MRVRIMLIGLMMALAVTTAWAAQTGGVRAIDVRSLDLGDVVQDWDEMPIVITNADDLYSTLGDEEAAAAIIGQIDFSKETLLYFKWVGSGEDRINVATVKTAKGREVTFVFRPGMTLELAPRHHMFAIPNDASWKVGEPVLNGGQ
jgi:superfamily I DNA/RNA helicase